MRNKLHNQGEMHTFLSCTVLSLLVVSSLFATPGSAAPRLLPPLGFSRQEYWSGLSCPPPGDLQNRGIESRSPTLKADSLLSGQVGKLLETQK